MALPKEWRKISGSYKIAQTTASDTVLKSIKKGTRFIECVTSGVVAIPSIAAYGTWEFDWYKGNTANTLNVNFISADTATGGQYGFGIFSDESVGFTNTGGGQIPLTAASYITNTTWYRARIVRGIGGSFRLFLKGGVLVPSYGCDGWTQVGFPQSLSTTVYSRSSYLLLNFNAGDRFTNLVVYNGNKLIEDGLIFNAPLDEFSTTKDLISGIIGTGTAIYNVSNGVTGNGRRWLEYNGTSSQVIMPNNTVGNIGSGDFTFVFVVDRKQAGSQGDYWNKRQSGTVYVHIYWGTNNKLALVTNSGNWSVEPPTAITTTGIHTIVFVSNRAGNTGTFYVNGTAIPATTYGTIPANLDNTATANMGFDGNATYSNDNVIMTRIFNYSLSSTQITNYSRPEYPIEAIDRGASGTILTSGTIVTGKKYKIIDWITDDNFVNVGGANVDGTIFTATGTTPTKWTNSSTLVALGAILDLNAEGMSSATWVDKTNSLTATNSGTFFNLPAASNLGAMEFGGTSIIIYGDADQFTLPNTNFSMSFELNNLARVSASHIFTKGLNKEYYPELTVDGYIDMYLWDSGADTNYSRYRTIAPAINTWNKYVFVYTSAQAGQWYINGIAVTTTKTNVGTGFSVFANTSYSLTIGGFNSTPTSTKNYLAKSIAFHKVALTAEEIAFLNAT